MIRRIEQLSVLMPAYNVMPFVCQAVESILGQTFGDFEFLIVDDGSTDGTGAYLDTLADPRVRVVHREHAGLAETLNAGLELAAHPWVARMDADDVALPCRLEEQVRFLERQDRCDLVSCAWGYIGRTGRRLGAVQVPRLEDPAVFRPLTDPMILHQGMVYRRRAVLGIGGYRDGAAEDMDLCLRLEEAGSQMTSMPQVLMLVRVLPGGISSQRFVEQRVRWAHVRECARARRRGDPEPAWEEFRAERWPRGAARLRAEGARQFRLAGAAWGAERPLAAAGRLLLSAVLRPDHVIRKLATYARSARQCGPPAATGPGGNA